jgi:hypothetical protein
MAKRGWPDATSFVTTADHSTRGMLKFFLADAMRFSQ